MSRAAAAATARRSASRSAHRPFPGSYLKRSEMPLASLLFLIPFIVLYELGTRYFAFDPAHQTERRIIAFNLMHQFFQWCGATGKYMPPLAIIAILLAVHIARNDPWKVSSGTLLGMAAESAAWAVPLLAIGTLAARYLYHHLPLLTGQGDWRTMIVLSLGAGIYEELVFRLVGLIILHILLIDVLRMPKRWGYLAMVVVTSIVFAQYHYWGGEVFSWRSFVFRTIAGAYFACLFLTRGFGITAFTHACYDIFLVLLGAIGGA
jgi:membrane protease YdiL (CAAX protease family)